ncbi:MAG: amidohydrolase [Candidatus Heimdallarchaeota archaeon]|nr:amidohydrolase [Candidatus Heimdallarchaeota archaeon]MCK5143138.1 amidohydrolase [Candidatus Heimdallarchaeota archaeon]
MELAVEGRLAIYFDNDFDLKFVKNPLLIIEEDRIVEIGTYDKTKHNLSGHDVVGDKNQLIIPGLINSHTHLAMTVFRGIADDIPLKTWLEENIWPLEAKLTEEDVYQGALLGSMESILSGVTTVNSMYWYPEFEAKAISDVGLKGIIAAPVITGITTLEDAIDIVKEHHNSLEETIRVSLALHSPYTVSISDFKAAHKFMKEYNSENPENPEVLIHTHLAESETEIKDSKKFNEKYEIPFPNVKTPVQFLDKIGILDENLMAAHCIHVNNKDINLLKDKRTKISLNPLSNAKLGNHMPPIPEIIKSTRLVGLGTDGPSSNNTLDLFDTIRFLSVYYKGLHHNPTLIKAEEAFRLATIGGAKAIGWQGIGTLEKNSFADIVTINLKKPHLTPNFDDKYLLNHFAYSMKGNDVTNVISNGKIILENSTLLNRDIDITLDEIEKITHRLVSTKSENDADSALLFQSKLHK